MGKYLLAHDLGTSGNKATLFRTDGTMVGSQTVPYPVYYDQPLWAEQDGADWWNAVCSSTKELLRLYGVSGEEVHAVSFSGQMMGCLPIDRDGNTLCRALIWADQRAIEESNTLREKISDERFYSIVGHRNTASYGIQKAMWLKKHRRDIYEKTWKFLNAKDYMVYRLTGQCFTDCSDANSMTCFDLAKRNWSEEIVAASGVDYEKLPKVVESTTRIGKVTEKAAKETGLSTNTEVIIGAGDGVAANIGAGCVEPGNTYCCMGTSAWVVGTSEKPVLDPDRRIVCWAHAVPGLYSPNGTMQFAGGSYKWLKETICHEEIAMAGEKG
ncbi:MAG: FGGY family carbohydrate kinase [Eubacteriales bacterium]|nr:FGGY family carbohydrate kinase [Eubacteriales bacterium]